MAAFIEPVEKQKIDNDSGEILSRYCGQKRENYFSLLYLMNRF
jgi:hypothetical protein